MLSCKRGKKTQVYWFLIEDHEDWGTTAAEMQSLR
jgi:hypothetical protein